MHIWNRPWPFIYEHHNRVPMLLSVTFDEIVTLIWNFYWAHKFVASWIRSSCLFLFAVVPVCGLFGLWPFRFVAVSVCVRFGLCPFRFVAFSVCGHSGLWPFRFAAVPVCGRFGLWPFRFVAVPVCGRSGLWPFRFWSFRFMAVMTRILVKYQKQTHVMKHIFCHLAASELYIKYNVRYTSSAFWSISK